ncbi:hypothetical protein KBH77_00570 [Patescibacteria group bacterium]|mgnify:FL=1|jgi:hypothetical protein|nr:hypothetical protein [Patescibacteria group bacterium]MBP8688832.1 hypothetical protein [Patescibacteria group bacterium]HCM29802.1 hypothetical protein [Bacteroidales bacterium]
MGDLEDKEKFIELRAKGWTFDKIAKELHKRKATLIDWSKELESEIANRKAIELEVLYEKHYLLKEQRIEKLGNLLNKIINEIDNRNLKDIPTDKLFDLLLKYNKEIKEEMIEPVYKSTMEIENERQSYELLKTLTVIESDNHVETNMELINE